MMEQDIIINRELYDKANEVRLLNKQAAGVNEKIVKHISANKQEPRWMLDLRLKSLKAYQQTPLPTWGPDLSALELEKIHYFMQPNAKKNSKTWEEVPEEIKNTFEKLGIPEAERKSLAGVGAQYESEVIYHKLKEELEEQGVIFLDMDVALKEHEAIIKEHFNRCVPYNDHKFAMLHYAVWSGGTFIYVPKGVKVTQPLQAYFRMNAERGGQFEHTLIIIEEEAEASYIEGCFAKGTQIKCQEGYKKIEEIKEGEKVLTTEGIYKKAKDLQRTPFSGEEYTISTYGDPTRIVITTENHPFLYVDRKYKNDRNKTFNPRWNIPRYFKKGDYLCIPIEKKITKKQEHTFSITKNREEKKIKVKLTKEFFRLVGYYLAEGSVSNNSYLNFSFASKEKEFIKDVKQCIKKVFGIEKTLEMKHKKNNGTSVVICSVELARIFKQLGTKANNKALPEWMMWIEPEKQKEIIKGWYLGDGNYYKKRTKSEWLKELFRINTVSEQLATQMRDMLLRQKIVAYLNKRNREKEGRQTMYTVGITGEHMVLFGELVGEKIAKTINGKRRASMFGIDNKFAYYPIKTIKRKKVKNKIVYNFGVEDHETYTAERFAVHNCSAPKYNSSSIHAGCVELFVKKNARLRYSSVENWSANTYNLNTKRAIVDQAGIIEWVGGNLGSGVTMLYPASILRGDGAKAEHLSIAFATDGQNQDTGAKVYHIGKSTSSTIVSKSISKTGGTVTYRGIVKVGKGASNAKSNVECDSLMIGKDTVSNTIPLIDVKDKTARVGHEARVGRIGEEQLFYLRSRGLDEETATKMIVAGFIEPITKELPLEYAVELNKLIELEMEGSVG